MVEQYLQHSRFILSDDYTSFAPNRTGVHSISRFGYRDEYDLGRGFPALTTKKMNFKSIIHELIWFLRGDSNIKYLVDNGVHIWDANAFDYYLKKTGQRDRYGNYSEEWSRACVEYIGQIAEDPEFARQHGDLGPVYGQQWRHWKTSDGKEIDQLEDVVELLHKSPQSRRIIVSAWNPEEIHSMALPPCHLLYQFKVREDKLDCQLYQRSCDMFLGVPFNIMSYAMLTMIMAQQANLKPGLFSHVFGDAHFYCGTEARGDWYGTNLPELKQRVRNVVDREQYEDVRRWIVDTAPAETAENLLLDHVPLILLQLTRQPRALPQLHINPAKMFDQLTFADFRIEGYDPHPHIKGGMAV